jgi:hypothetical protein
VVFRSQHHLVCGDNELAYYSTCEEEEEEVAEITCTTLSTTLDQFKAVEILSLPNSSARLQHKGRSLAGTLVTMPSSPTTITW